MKGPEVTPLAVPDVYASTSGLAIEGQVRLWNRDEVLTFSDLVVLSAVGRRGIKERKGAHMSAEKRKRKNAKERKRAQKRGS